MVNSSCDLMRTLLYKRNDYDDNHSFKTMSLLGSLLVLKHSDRDGI